MFELCENTLYCYVMPCENTRYCYVMPCKITLIVHLLITFVTIYSRRRLKVNTDTTEFQWPISKQIHYFSMDVAAYTHTSPHKHHSVCGLYSIAFTRVRYILYFAQWFSLVRGMCLRSVVLSHDVTRDTLTSCSLHTLFLCSNQKLAKQEAQPSRTGVVLIRIRLHFILLCFPTSPLLPILITIVSLTPLTFIFL